MSVLSQQQFPDGSGGNRYTEAPEHVSKAAIRRFEGGGKAVLHPEKPGTYLHNVNDYTNGAREFSEHPDGGFQYKNPYNGHTDRFDEGGYYDHNGEHMQWSGSQ